MTVKYINHSSFIVEIKDIVFIFDYFEGNLPEYHNKHIYFFNSHSHSDHYSSKIFSLYKDCINTYILSSDINYQKKDNIYFMNPYVNLIIDNIKINTLKSTDQGVAFIINYNNINIYHAGDLNWWHWEGEEDEYNIIAAAQYKNEIDKLKNINFDIAFVPLDPRLGNAYLYGLNYFAKNINVKRIYPMHMWNKYDVIDQLKKSSDCYYCDIIENKDFYQ